jgi:hypothetical protein
LESDLEAQAFLEKHGPLGLHGPWQRAPRTPAMDLCRLSSSADSFVSVLAPQIAFLLSNFTRVFSSEVNLPPAWLLIILNPLSKKTFGAEWQWKRLRLQLIRRTFARRFHHSDLGLRQSSELTVAQKVFL